MTPTNRFPFTKTRLEALQAPQDGRAYHYDTKQDGLTICVTAAASKTFYLYRWANGRPVRILIGRFPQTSIENARKAARALVGEMAKGNDPQAARQARRHEATLAELWENYLELHAKPRKKSWKDDERQYNKYLAPLHNKRLSAITQAVVAKWHGGIAKDHGPIQANRCKALLATMFSKASAAVGYTGQNPVAGVANFPEQSRERFLLPAEMKAFFTALAALDAYWQAFFLLCLFTGSRRGNVASMEWAEIDLENAVWHIPQTKTKNKRPTTISLCAPALAILRTRHEQRNGSPYVFPAFKGDGHLIDPRKAWDRLLTTAKLENLHMHDLRRTQGSWQAAMGISLAIIGKSLGHADLKSTQVYSRLQLDPVKDAVSRASGAMIEAAGVQIGTNGVKLLEHKEEKGVKENPMGGDCAT
jgi:integrase